MKAKIIMLPTEDRTDIYLHSESKELVFGFMNARSTKHIPQHLYAIIDEQIQEGDWFYHVDGLNHIKWIEQRLKAIHNENPNYDYMLKLNQISNWIKENLK